MLYENKLNIQKNIGITLIVCMLMISTLLSNTSAYATTIGGAVTMEAGKKITFNVPNGGDNVDLVGILIKRYQPSIANSTNEGQYTNVVKIDGKEEWYIGTDQGVKSGDTTKFEIKYDSSLVQKTMFSDWLYAEEFNLTGHNLLKDNNTFKFEVTPIYRLPDWRDLRGDKVNIFYKTEFDEDAEPPEVPDCEEGDCGEDLPPFEPQVCKVDMTFSDGDNMTGSKLTADPTGKITEDESDANSRNYNVMNYGIPSSDKLQVYGESEKYLQDFKFQQRKGELTYTIKVVKDFKKKWTIPEIPAQSSGVGSFDMASWFTACGSPWGDMIHANDMTVGMQFYMCNENDGSLIYVVTDITYRDPANLTGDIHYKRVGSSGVDVEGVPAKDKSNSERQEKVFTEKHNVTFWKIGHLLVYKFNDALFKNYALPNGEVGVNNNNIVVVNTLHDDVDKNHVITKPCKDFYLGSSVIDGGAEEPNIPDWSGEAQSKVTSTFSTRIPDVKNDKVVVDGTIRMTDSVVTSNGARPTSIPNATKVPVSQNNLVIEAYKQNKWKTPSSITSRYHAVAQVNKSGNDLAFTGNSPSKINVVTVHTPVVMYSKSTDDKEHDQRLDAPVRVGNEDSDRHAIVLDRPFTVTLPTRGQHLQTSTAPGYGNRDYQRYTKEKEVQFPFDVYTETKQQMYTAGTWIKVPVTQETATFMLPVWVPEGSYTAKFRSIAINAVGVTPEEHHANLNLTYRTTNGAMANHVAYDTIKMDVVGRLYDFRVTDVLDYNWEGVFRKNNGLIEHTENYYWTGIKGIDGGNRGNAEPYTLPIRHGSHPKGYKNVSVKTGYSFRFDTKTKGSLWRATDAVRVTPRFYFVNKDGKNRREVDVYYHNDSKYFVKIGSANDKEYRSIKLNEPLRNVEEKQIREMGEYLYKYPTEYGYSSAVNSSSKVKFLKDYERKYSKKNVVTGHYGWQMLSWGLRTFIGPDADSVPGGAMVNADRAKASEQQWYGEYSLPSDLYVVEKGKDVSGYGLQHRMNKSSALFLRDGYVIVNFKIETIKNGDTDKPDLGYGGGSGNQWELEGYKKSFTDKYGKVFNLMNGDIMFYHGDRSSGDDYGGSVIQ